MGSLGLATSWEQINLIYKSFIPNLAQGESNASIRVCFIPCQREEHNNYHYGSLCYEFLWCSRALWEWDHLRASALTPLWPATRIGGGFWSHHITVTTLTPSPTQATCDVLKGSTKPNVLGQTTPPSTRHNNQMHSFQHQLFSLDTRHVTYTQEFLFCFDIKCTCHHILGFCLMFLYYLRPMALWVMAESIILSLRSLSVSSLTHRPVSFLLSSFFVLLTHFL